MGGVDASNVYADLDGISTDAAGLKSISDAQGGAMNYLASTLDDAARALRSPAAGIALQRVGADLHQAGMQMGATFSDQGDMMSGNTGIYDNADQDAGSHISSLDALT